MDFNSILDATIYNKWFYAGVGGLALVSYATIRKVFNKVPILNNKRNLLVACVVGFLATGGFLANMGFSSTGSLNGGSDVNIIDVQTTTAMVGNGTESVSTTVPRTTDMRFTDAQATGDGITDANGTIITLTRSGDLTDAAGVPLKCIVPADYVDQDGVTAQTTYQHLIERDALGNVECYLQNGAVATTSSQKGLTSAVFSAGSGTATFGVSFSVDENGHDAMNQYNSLPVQIVNSDSGEVLWTYNIFRMD